MRWVLLPIIVLLSAGCPKPGLVVGPSGLRSQDGFPAYIGQPCEHSAWIIAAAEQIQPIVRRETEKAGLTWHDPGRWWLCLVEQPQSCFGCAGVGCARRRGCTTRLGTSISRLWPPQCTEAWPDEPTCSNKPQTDEGLVEDLGHELVEVQARSAALPVHAHAPPWDSVSRSVVEKAKKLNIKTPTQAY